AVGQAQRMSQFVHERASLILRSADFGVILSRPDGQHLLVCAVSAGRITLAVVTHEYGVYRIIAGRGALFVVASRCGRGLKFTVSAKAGAEIRHANRPPPSESNDEVLIITPNGFTALPRCDLVVVHGSVRVRLRRELVREDGIVRYSEQPKRDVGGS